MPTLSTMQRGIDAMTNALKDDPFTIDGFSFTSGNETKFNPYTLEASEKAGFPFMDGMSKVDGFFYLSDEYEAYLDILKETGKEHPTNVDKVEWVSYDN